MSGYALMWCEKVSLLTVDAYQRAVIDFAGVIGNGAKESLIFIEDGKRLEAYFSAADYSRIEREHGEYFLKTERIGNLLGVYVEIEAEWKMLFAEFGGFDAPAASNPQLLALFEKYCAALEKLVAFYRSTRPEAEARPEQRLLQLLSLRFGAEANENFGVLTEQSAEDEVLKEKTDWLDLLEQARLQLISDAVLLDYARAHAWFFWNVYDRREAIAFLRKRLNEDVPKIREKEGELKAALGRLKELKATQERITAEFIEVCPDEKAEFVALARLFQEFGLNRLKLKCLFAGAEFYCLAFFEEIARRIGINAKELFDCYAAPEVNDFLKNGKRLQGGEIAARKQCVAYSVKNGERKIYSGNAALELKKRVENGLNRGAGDFLKGVVASPGRATGVVRVILSTNVNDFALAARGFSQGDVLVTDMTQPHMTVLMRKAGAIVTNVGGLTSHAAIMSREFGVPCVVGTRNATKTLCDGDVVEVDAFEGVVRKL